MSKVSPVASALPPYVNGMRIGLLGGSFDPPHLAHRAITLFAIKRLKLDRVWWLVTPGNPLKTDRTPHDLAERMEAAKEVAHDPRIDVSCLESVIGTRYTADTIRYLCRRASGLHFVWIMGADNLRSFHRWQKWRGIAAMVPIAVVDRATTRLAAMSGPAAQALAAARIPEHAAKSLPYRRPPAWVFLHGLKSPLSSTALRALRGGGTSDRGRRSHH